VVILRAFIKKTEKAPRGEIDLALQRAKELKRACGRPASTPSLLPTIYNYWELQLIFNAPCNVARLCPLPPVMSSRQATRPRTRQPMRRRFKARWLSARLIAIDSGLSTPTREATLRLPRQVEMFAVGMQAASFRLVSTSQISVHSRSLYRGLIAACYAPASGGRMTGGPPLPHSRFRRSEAEC
jgi:hypothetical protein